MESVGLNPIRARAGIKKEEVLRDYRLAVLSREASYIGRREVFMGKAKFGIFGDGKELAQLALSKFFNKGDFRAGYYRDQTLMFAIGALGIQEFFAQLYAHTDLDHEPSSGGRLMNSHFSTRLLDEKGDWKELSTLKNSSSDISCTAGQMPRLVGLGYASKLYRQNTALHGFKKFSNNGNEIAFGTIGDASTAEGHFYEALNAMGILQIPVVLSVWDDAYGISVPKEYATVKSSISEVLAGFQKDNASNGIEIFVARAWNYEELISTYREATEIARKSHIPCLVHVTEVTQPQGHSTSGSHHRYKSKKRLLWEEEFDCNLKFKEWILAEGLYSESELNQIEDEAKKASKKAKNSAWQAYKDSLKTEIKEVKLLISMAKKESGQQEQIGHILEELNNLPSPIKSEYHNAVRKTLRYLTRENSKAKYNIIDWLENKKEIRFKEYSSFLHSRSAHAAIKIKEVKPRYNDDPKVVDGREVLRACFDHHLTNNPKVFAIGEDVGKIGDVNQGFAGLQEKHGKLRVTDTGIRETTIMGQGIGAALRGLRPIVEVQYLDYLMYCTQTLSDDLACLHYRTVGGQKAPLIVRTRGHRLEGVWHSGSPMGMILGCLRGIYVLVPRNMTQAAGFYNTMLDSDDPCIIIESLNGYRLKEKIPENLPDIRTPLGIPEIMTQGGDLTIVTYGSLCRLAVDVAFQLREFSIEAEVIDVQSLLPFDRNNMVVESLKKTNRIIFLDEDVPGGASAFMMQKVLEEQNGYRYLDSKPITLTGKEHRPAYSTDGDYFSKPSMDDIFEAAYLMMHESNPKKYPSLYD